VAIAELPLETSVPNVTPRILAILDNVVLRSLGALNEYTGSEPAALENESPPVKV
jgi:hypothetical protein